MIKACVFDFDGTIIDSTESIWREYLHVINKMDLREITYQEFTSQLGKPWDTFLTTLWPGIDVNEFSKTYRQEKEETKLIPHVSETLNKLHGKYRLALLTSRGQKTLYRILESAKMDESLFDLIVDKEALTTHKPDPEALNHLLREMKLGKEEIVYMGDSVIDAICAKNAGVTFIGVLTGGATRKDFEDVGAKHIIESISELPSVLALLG